MRPICRFFFALIGIGLGITAFWASRMNMINTTCDAVDGRVCNNRGECGPFGKCICDPLFSGTACQHTGIMNYNLLTDEPCDGNGIVIKHGKYVFPECVETQPGTFTVRKGGWDSTPCRNRLAVARKRLYMYETPTTADLAGLPMCLCKPPYGGPGCTDICPRSNDGEVCSGNGNQTVGYTRNNTEGVGCQCTTAINMLMPNVTSKMSVMQWNEIQKHSKWFESDICAKLVQIDLHSIPNYTAPATERVYGVGPSSVFWIVVPAVQSAYQCYCDARSFGSVCQFSVCDRTEDGQQCGGHGHKALGFGAEYNTTRSVSEFGQPGTPICKVGKDGCCVENQGLCGISELQCPDVRPYRCSSTARCVATPKASRCEDGWQYGYWDDPNKAPRRPFISGSNTLASRLVAYFFRITSGTIEFEYRGVTYYAPEGAEFWAGSMNETIEEMELRAFDSSTSTVVTLQKENNKVEFWPAPFVHGDTDYDRIVRLHSTFPTEAYAVVDIRGSRVDIVPEAGEGTVILANISTNAYIRPGGSVVDLTTCLDDLRSCSWPSDDYSLCERNGRIGSVRGAGACDFPSRVFEFARTVAVGVSRVPIAQWDGDAVWTSEPLLGSTYRSTLVITASEGAVWSGTYVSLDDLRVPCVCELPPTGSLNASTWNAKWASELTRPVGQIGAHVLAKTEVVGDSRWERGVLINSTHIINDEGHVHSGILTTKMITKEEYVKGRPTPIDAIYPSRCPDGKAATPYILALPDVPASANCSMSGNVTTCDNGCTCSTTKCTCASDPESEAELFRLVSEKREGKCWIIRSDNGNWTRTVRNFTTTCFTSSSFDVPLLFKNVYNVTGLMARFFGGSWFEVPYDLSTVGSNTRMYPVIDDVTKPYDEWCALHPDGTDDLIEAEFVPFGISVYRTVPDYVISASEDSEVAATAVVWNDLTVWSSAEMGWIRIDFPDTAPYLTGVYVEFEQMGVGALSTTVDVHTGPLTARNQFRSDWEWAGEFVGNAVANVTSAFKSTLVLASTVRSLRLVSRFPMSIRRLIPLTNQICTNGLLIPEINVYPEDVISQVTTDRRINETAESCISDDSCTLGGSVASTECADYKFLTWGLEPVYVTTISANLTATQVVMMFLPNYTSTVFTTTCWGNCCAWGATVPTTPYDCAANSDPVLLSDTIVGAYTAYPPQYVTTYQKRVWGANLEEGVNTCRNGTQKTLCGASSRLDSTNPGLDCVASPLELAFRDRNTSLREFQSSADVTELLGSKMQMRLNFTLSWTRPQSKLARASCGDCDGRVRCADGVCADYQGACPVTYYITPGDGCVKVDTERKSYMCACELGYSGKNCMKHECTPLDIHTGKGDPHEWCTCGGHFDRKYPKLRAKPPFLFKQKPDGYTRKEILQMNRARPRKVAGDVGWENVKFTEAPWGVALKRQFRIAGVTKYSNCGFYVRVPDGRLMDLDDCVEQRATVWPYEVLKWREWPLINGTVGNVTYAWDGPWAETKYDDAPIRCGSTCVSDERECYRNNLVNPPCGGHGKCLADSSCECASGRETFVLTDRVSLAVSVPYASRNGVSDPTNWAEKDPVWYDTATCDARNCTAVDCSPPYGCFPGTQTINFADRLIACGEASGHKGMCGADSLACSRGAVSSPTVCSGNGVLRKRDYRDEWYCECGSPRSLLIKDTSAVRETSELVPNGFGGPRCDQYECQDKADAVWIRRTDPKTNLPYVGSDGLAIPHKWIGPCGVPTGPKVEDLSLWQRCCPGYKKLDKCPYVPCNKGRTDKKAYTCELAQNCLDATSVPMVYPCNGHGKPLADGTCACDNTDTAGFTYDESIWSGKGCIKRTECEMAQTSRTVCNKKQDCGDFDSWSEMPYIPYMEQQWPQVAIRHGLPPTNQSFIDFVFRDDRVVRIRFVAAQKGQAVVDATNAAATTICVYPDDDPDNPRGMLPYDPAKTCTYGEGFDAPYMVSDTSFEGRSAEVTASVIKEMMTNDVFGERSVVSNVQYIPLSRTNGMLPSNPLTYLKVSFPSPIKLRAIRIHGRKASTSASDVKITFLNEDDVEVCPRPPAVSRTDYHWIGPDQAWYCVPTYKEFNFKQFLYQAQYRTNCQPDAATQQCYDWQDQLCASLGHEVNPPGDYLRLFPGCNNARCCYTEFDVVYDPVTSLKIQLGENALGHALDIDELQIYGVPQIAGVEATPDPLSREIAFQLAGDATKCRDAKLMDIALAGQTLTAHVLRNWTSWEKTPGVNRPADVLDTLDFYSARDACRAQGSQFGTNRGGETRTSEMETMGVACYADGNANNVPCIVNARDRNLNVNVASRGRTCSGSTGGVPTQCSWTDAAEYDPFFVRGCTDWGCWTPVPNTMRDVVATPAFHPDLGSSNALSARPDPSGELWKSNWCADCWAWDEFMYQLYLESARQQFMVRGTRTVMGTAPLDYRIYTMNMIQTAFRKRNGFFNVAEGRSYDPDFWMQLYDPILTTGNALPAQPTLSDFRAELRAENDSAAVKSAWTNPQTCVVTVFSVPMCGRFAMNLNLNPPNDGGAKRSFVVTPADDYAALDLENIIQGQVFNECVHEYKGINILGAQLGVGCSYFGLPIIGNFHSFTIQGPCMVEFKGRTNGRDYTYYVENERYNLIPRVHMWHTHSPRYTIHQQNGGLSGDYDNMDPGGYWQDGCYPQFNREQPFTTWASYCNVDWPLNCFHDKPLPFWLETPQSQAPDGMPPRSQTSMRIAAKFNSRKIEYLPRARANATKSNENDFVMGFVDHPHMCSRMSMVQTKRVYAGFVTPNTQHVDVSPDYIGRWSKKSTPPTHTQRTYAQRTVTTNDDYRTRVYIDDATEPAGFAPFRESVPQEISFSLAEMQSKSPKGLDTVFTHDFVSCASLGRPVPRCNECEVSRTPKWQWNQQFLNPENVVFVTDITNPIRGPVVHVSYKSTRVPTLVERTRLADIESVDPAVFARLSSTFSTANLDLVSDNVTTSTPGYYYDECLAVTSPADNVYAFMPTLCQKKTHRAVCIRDFRRFTIQSGCQADECGCDSRSTYAQPNTTAFDLYPLADAEKFPVDHAIKDAWLGGTLDTYLDLNPLPADAVVAYLWSTNQSFIHAFPGVYDLFWSGISTRKSYLSPGQLEDPQSWVDFNLKAWFPHSCGKVYSKYTGEGYPMCARSAEFCTLDTVFPDVLMAEDDVPTALQSIGEFDDVVRIGQCGRYVAPWAMLQPTEDAPPPPADGRFLVLEHGSDTDYGDDYVTIKTLGRLAYVRNTQRDVGVIKPGSTVVGRISCAVPASATDTCKVRLWIGSLNPAFLDSELKLDIGDLLPTSGSNYTREVPTDIDLNYRTLGWDIEAPLGSTLKIGRVLITDADSIAACKRSKIARPFVEPQPNMVSPAPQHQCVTTDRQALILPGGCRVGQCCCSPASPYGGPACEWPATISKHGKRVCNLHPGVRKTKSKEIAPTGEIVTVNEHGVYQYNRGGVKFGCKPRSDLGSILKARLVPNSVSDFRYVVKTIKKPNEEEYTSHAAAEVSAIDPRYHPTPADFITSVCNAFSSDLPSFTTTAEFASYNAKLGETGFLNFTGVYLDITGPELRWQQRSEYLVINATRNMTEPCAVDADVCAALNFNNYAFGSGSSFLTDGLNTTGTVDVVGVTLALRGFLETSTVVLVGATNPSGITVETGTGASCSGTGVIRTCSDPMSSVKVYSTSGTQSLNEIGVFWSLDDGRVGLFAEE